MKAGVGTSTGLGRRSNVVSVLHARHLNLTVFSATAATCSALAPQCSQAKSIDTLHIVEQSPRMAAVSARVQCLSEALRGQPLRETGRNGRLALMPSSDRSTPRPRLFGSRRTPAIACPYRAQQMYLHWCCVDRRGQTIGICGQERGVLCFSVVGPAGLEPATTPL